MSPVVNLSQGAFGIFHMLMETKRKDDVFRVSLLELHTTLCYTLFQGANGCLYFEAKKLFESDDFQYDSGLSASGLPATAFIHLLAFKILEDGAGAQIMIPLPTSFKEDDDCIFLPQLKHILEEGLGITTELLPRESASGRRKLLLKKA